MTSKVRGRQAVYIVTVPITWKPQRPWDVPPGFTSGALHTKNLPMFQASGFAKTFNKEAIQQRERGAWDRKWAIVAKHLKARQHGEHPDARVKGGAA